MGIKVNGKVIPSDMIGQSYRQKMNNVDAARADEEARRKTLAETEASRNGHANSGAGAGVDASAAADEAKAKASARNAKLAEIMAMTDEEARLEALLDFGFTAEAAAETKRRVLGKAWSALITALNRCGVISTADETTYAVLSKASEIIDNAERIAYVRENGLVELADIFEKVCGGDSVDVYLADLEKKAAEIEAAAAAENAGEGGDDGTGAGAASEEESTGTGEAAEAEPAAAAATEKEAKPKKGAAKKTAKTKK